LQRRERGRRRRVPRRAPAVPRDPGGRGGDACRCGHRPGSGPGRSRRGRPRCPRAGRRSPRHRMTWLVVIGGLVLLVFLHELGHFSVALAVGMRPRSFYIGFPPALVKVKRRGIEYGIGAIPLGGFVRIPGMHRPAGADLTAFMAPALREEPGLAPAVQRVRHALDADDFAAAREALPDLRRETELTELSPGARRSTGRALREVDEGTAEDAYWRQVTWK